MTRFNAYRRDKAECVKTGKLHEDIFDGLENVPTAFIGLLQGKNFGKLIVRLNPP